MRAAVGRRVANPTRGAGELLRRARAGDPEAFIQLTEPLRDQVHSVLVRMVGRDDAEDLSQEVFIRAFRFLRRFRGDAALSTWLTRIAINTAIRHASRTRKRETVPLDAEECRVEPSESPPDVPASMAVHEAVGALSPKLRAAVVLFYFQGLGLDEMAATLGIRRGTAASRLHEARRLLRDKLLASGIGEGR
jgi:RNA polymerase sigma-70 factor (ECF subfamily)